MPYLKPAKKAGKYSKFTPPGDLTRDYLGGFTFPGLTGRKHMGPGNWVSSRPGSLDDEPYRQHDIAYGKMTNPYFNFNQADADLLRSRGTDWPDLLAKGVFAAKGALDLWQTPSLYEGGYAKRKKGVYAKNYYDAELVPWHDTSGWHSGGDVVGGPSYARRKDFGYYDPTGRSPYSEITQGGGGFVPETRSYSASGMQTYPGKRPPGYRPHVTGGPGKGSKLEFMSSRYVFD